MAPVSSSSQAQTRSEVAWILWVSAALFAASVFFLALPDPFWIVMLGIPIACLMLVVTFILLIWFLARRLCSNVARASFDCD
jgi:hypothetical protein